MRRKGSQFNFIITMKKKNNNSEVYPKMTAVFKVRTVYLISI